MPTVTTVRPAYDLADPTTLTLDLDNPKPKEVLALHEAFEAAIRDNPDLGPLPVTTGWNQITPAVAVNLLLRNRPGANRWLDPATVYYYAAQMADDDWKATGQPILVETTGKLLDAQHRLYGVLISGSTIKSYVVTDIEPLPDLFARIDNGKVRSAADALRTAGLNGVSPVITKVLRFAEEVRAGVYDPNSGASKLARFAPVRTLRLIDTYPNVRIASRSAASDWSEAVKYLGNRKDMVAYVGMRIIDEHDEGVADDFFDAVMDSSDHPADHPIAALRKVVDASNRAPKQMKRQNMAAILIQAFNAWHNQETLGRRWQWNSDNENFPVLVEAEVQAEAAE